MKNQTTVPARRAARVEPAEHEPGVSLGLAALLYFGLALLYFLPALLPGRHVFGTDYLAGGYFSYSFISERLAAGALPKWVPHVYGGLPLLANPGSTYHPVHMLADLLLPVTKVFPVVFIFHFGMAGVGMYLLSRELGTRSWVALVAGLAFEFTGITMSWVYAGHDGRIMVTTMAPLVFFFLHRGIRTARLGPFVGAAAAIGFALLSFQIQNAYYLLLAAAVWAVFCLVQLGALKDGRRAARTIAFGLGAVAFAFALAAVNFLPFQDYVAASPRGQAEGRGYEYAVSYSMPPVGLVAMAVPEHVGASVADPTTGEPLLPAYRVPGGFKLHTEYVGALVIVLLALGALYTTRRDAQRLGSVEHRYWWFFAGLALFAVSLALGGNTPLYHLYYAVLPGLKRFRAPDLAYYVAAFSTVVMAALTLERLALLRAASSELRRTGQPSTPGLAKLRWVVAAVVGVALLGALATSGASAPGEPSRALGWARFALFAALVGGLLWAWSARKLTTTVAALALAVLTVADLWIIARKFFHTVDPPDVMFAADDVIAFLQAQPQPSRLWTFPLPEAYRSGSPHGGNYPMRFGLDQAGGEHGNQLQRYNEFLGAGEQTYTDWHNFLGQAQVVETPQGQAIAFQPVPGFLEAANIRYIVSMAPLAHPSLREVHRGSALVYENTAALPRAYLVPEVRAVAEGGALAAMQQAGFDPSRIAFVEGADLPPLPQGPLTGEAQVVRYAPDEVVVRTRASRPALLVLADNYYPGWEVTVDGQPAEVLRTNHTFRGVAVGAGEHEVRFRFRPQDLYVGLYVTLACFALLAGYGVYALLRARRRGPAAA